jgi:predicted nucleotidyltransferase
MKLADVPAKTEFQQVVELLVRHGVDFIVIGGQAETLHGSPRVTYDVDLCYCRARNNLQRLVAALKELKPTLRGAPPDVPFQLDVRSFELGLNFTFDTQLVALDLLGEVVPIGQYEDLLKHAESYPAYGTNLLTISLEDLLRVKQHINRPKDQESIYQLLAIQRLRKETGLR